jgi:Fur family peroxide stress response transcriptional regulator
VEAVRSPREARVEQMIEGVRAARLKVTPQRVAIIRELALDDSHPTAQELFDRLRPSLPMMSFATVYNTLDALAAAGLCRAMSLAPGSGRFDPNMEPHHHVVCDKCGAVRDVPIEGSSTQALFNSADEGAGATVVARASPGFRVRAVERIFRGVCAACEGRAVDAFARAR